MTAPEELLSLRREMRELRQRVARADDRLQAHLERILDAVACRTMQEIGSLRPWWKLGLGCQVDGGRGVDRATR